MSAKCEHCGMVLRIRDGKFRDYLGRTWSMGKRFSVQYPTRLMGAHYHKALNR